MSLLEFCNTEWQRRIVELSEQGLSSRKIAAELDCESSSVRTAIGKIRKRAEKRGYSPEYDINRIVPDGLKLTGLSDMRENPDGKPVWYKFSEDKDRQIELMEQFVESLKKDIPRLPKHPRPNIATNNKLCNVYTLTDCHVGMLAWRKEGGEDWDLKIAEDTLLGCFFSMVDAAPHAETAVVAEIGDFEHYDGYDSVTPTNGHQLDTDSRFPKIIEASIRIRRGLIDKALSKHERVVCVIAEGNHNIVSSLWMRKMFAALYENEPRVEIIDSDLPYYAFQFGKTMLAWHHGHLKKSDSLPLLFASQFPEIWGATKYRYSHSGHLHHLHIKEHSGMIHMQHPTLAARDAHAARGGYISNRQAIGQTYHKDYGLVGSNHVSPEMLRFD